MTWPTVDDSLPALRKAGGRSGISLWVASFGTDPGIES